MISEFPTPSVSSEDVADEEPSEPRNNEENRFQTPRESPVDFNLDGSQSEDFSDGCNQFAGSNKKKHLIKMIVPYVPTENIKTIFANLLRQLDINSRGFSNLKRSDSKRAIFVECDSAKLKQHFEEQESAKSIFASHLTDSVSSYDIPSGMPIRFEY